MTLKIYMCHTQSSSRNWNLISATESISVHLLSPASKLYFCTVCINYIRCIFSPDNMVKLSHCIQFVPLIHYHYILVKQLCIRFSGKLIPGNPWKTTKLFWRYLLQVLLKCFHFLPFSTTTSLLFRGKRFSFHSITFIQQLELLVTFQRNI